MNGGWVEGCGHIILSCRTMMWRLESSYKCPTCNLVRDDYPADKVRKKWQSQ